MAVVFGNIASQTDCRQNRNPGGNPAGIKSKASVMPEILHKYAKVPDSLNWNPGLLKAIIRPEENIPSLSVLLINIMNDFDSFYL